MTLYKAIQEIAKRLPDKMYPVGSFVRGKLDPSDLDIATSIPMKKVIQYFENEYGEVYIIRKGTKISFFYIPYENDYIKINVFKGNELQIPYLIFSYSYPRLFNIILRKRAKQMGYKLSQYGFYDENGDLIPINDYEDVFEILGVRFRTPYEEELRMTKYKDIKNGEKALQLIRSEEGSGIYQDILNQYRKRFCHGKARKLEDGEYHFLCGNYIGPGTDLSHKDYPSYNAADECAKHHDLEYGEIMKETDPKAMSKKIRISDKKIIECLKKAKSGIYSKAGISGIKAKMTFENTFPKLAKLYEGKYYGEE